MKKAILIPIIIGSVLLVTGSILFAVGFANNNNPKAKKVTNEHPLTETFENINVDVDISDFELVPTTDGASKLVFEETELEYHTYAVEDNTLKINFVDSRKWHEKMFNFGLENIKVTLYTPAKQFGELTVKNSTGDLIIPKGYAFNNANIKLSTGDVSFKCEMQNELNIDLSTGDVELEGTLAKNLSVKTSTGNVYLEDVVVQEKTYIKTSTGRKSLKNLGTSELELKGDTGKVTLTNVLAVKDMDIKSSTGDVKFDACDATNIKVKTSTGDVMGTLLTAKTFYAHSDTGKVNVPKTTGPGIVEIDSDTGDINISIVG